MAELSPQVQAVLDAYENSYIESGLAAALRAAALYCKRDGTILLSLADELEGVDD